MTGQNDSLIQKLQDQEKQKIFKTNQEEKNGGPAGFNKNYQINPKCIRSKSCKLKVEIPANAENRRINNAVDIIKLFEPITPKSIDKITSFDSLSLDQKLSLQGPSSVEAGPNRIESDLNHSDVISKGKINSSGSLKRSSFDFRIRNSEQFLSLREESVTNHISNIHHLNQNVSSPSSPTTPRLNTLSNNHSPQQQQRSSRPPFLASKHSQIIPVLSVNDVHPKPHAINNNINNINMVNNSQHTPSASIASKSARNSVINIGSLGVDEIPARMIYSTIDPNALKEYHEATKYAEIEVIDYKNKERKTVKVQDDRDLELVKQLTSIAKQNGSGVDVNSLLNNPTADIHSKQDSKVVANPELGIQSEGDDDNYSETIIDGHTNFTIAYNMLSGIKTSVNKFQEKVDKKLRLQRLKGNNKSMVEIKENDFSNTEKLKFIHKHKLLYTFKFKDYHPQVFSNLRKIFKINDEQYLESLTSKYVLSELNSPGKSGSFFYYSPDSKYIIKTIRRAEHKHLRKHLKEYYEHCEGNPETLLSQFYGLYRMKLPISLNFTNPPKSRRIYFIVMNNVFPMHIDQSFDLKGSLLGRITDVPKSNIPLRQRSFSKDGPSNNALTHSVVKAATAEDESFANIIDESLDTIAPLTLKDLNWLDNSMRLELDVEIGEDLKAQLNRDVALLKRLNTMDYSLLIGIHFINTEQFYYSDELLSKSVASKEGNKLYFIGIIDCLTNYSFIKKVETFFKSVTHSRDEISAVPPDMYGKRFVSFMDQNVLPVSRNKGSSISSKKNIIEPTKNTDKVYRKK
ncbi:hypothetical protein QEN19_001968 [Hanseniaspora menglaensis]